MTESTDGAAVEIEAPNWLPPGGRCFIRDTDDLADGVTVFVIDPETDLRKVVWAIQNYFPTVGYVAVDRVELRVVHRQAPGKGERP